MTHSISQVAADAGSLAVTKKLDRIVEEEMQRRTNAIAEQNRGSSRVIQGMWILIMPFWEQSKNGNVLWKVWFGVINQSSLRRWRHMPKRMVGGSSF